MKLLTIFTLSVFISGLSCAQGYPRFSKPIRVIDSCTYQFGDKILTLHVEDKRLKALFDLGIFNPDVIFGAGTTKISQAELDTMSQTQRVFFNMLRNDIIEVCCFHVKTISAHTRRFVFWQNRKGIANPIEYYFDCYNPTATRITSLEDFISGSRMRAFKRNTIII